MSRLGERARRIAGRPIGPLAALALALASLALPPALPAQLPAGRTVVFSEALIGNWAGPYYVVLDSGAVYRVEFEPSDDVGPLDATSPRIVLLATPTVVDYFTLGISFAAIGPRYGYRPPALTLRPLDDATTVNRGQTLLLFPVATGEYRIQARAAPGATVRLRILREDSDNLEWACVSERDRGAPGPACARLRAARRGPRLLGLPVGFAALLLPVAAHLIIPR